MGINRRGLVFAGGIGVGLQAVRLAKAQVAVGPRVSQAQLDEGIRMHQAWLNGDPGGKRAVFAGRNLSGLVFPSADVGFIDLSAADFTEADLCGTTAAGLISFKHVSFYRAHLDSSVFLLPAFEKSDMRCVRAHDAVWGSERKPALISAATMGKGTFTRARVFAFFEEVYAHDSCWESADLSFSRFLGDLRHRGTSFSRSVMRRTRFCHCWFNGASLNGADCTAADFRQAIFMHVHLKRAVLTGINVEGAQLWPFPIEHWCTPHSREGHSTLKKLIPVDEPLVV